MDNSFEKQTGKTKEYILECAIDLISERGFKDVSVREIAQKVGIKASSLYKHYKNKDEILNSIFEMFRNVMNKSEEYDNELFQTQGDITPEAFLTSSFLAFKELMFNPHFFKLAKIINLEQSKNKLVRAFFIQEMIDKPILQLSAFFEMFIRAGKIRPLDPQMLAKTYHSYIISAYYVNSFLKEELDVPAVEKDMLDYIHFFCEAVKV